MTEKTHAAPDWGGWAGAWVTALLSLSAMATIGYWTIKALGRADTEPMESPLMLSVARQLVSGPGELYGPFGGGNPLVLIHAPLYYRCAALLAWPMARAGLHPAEAARLAGRAVSALGLVAAMGAVYRLGRLGGLPARAGLWSALLVAAAPVLGGQPYAVRPDMVGVALQAWGAALALGSLAGPRRRLGLASVLFGLAACVKQHLLGAWAVSATIAAVECLRGRRGPGVVARVVLPGLAVAVVAYGIEWWLTAGRVWQATIVAAAHVGRVHPGDWDHAFLVFLGIVKSSAGVIAMLAAAALVAAGARPGVVRWLLAGAGTLAIGLALVATVLETSLRPSWTGVAIVLAAVLAAFAAVPATVISGRLSSPSAGIDAALWAYMVAELALAALLARMSAGAWLNYAIPATVFAAALAGRSLSRALDAGPPPLAALPAVLAALAMLASSLDGLTANERRARLERAQLAQVDEQLHRPRSSYYFTDRPGLNRLDGRLELVHDDWLYPVFESLGLAEPRASWLGPALARGAVRVVVCTGPGPMLEGTTLDLRRLGYRPTVRRDPFFVWTR
jgi:hypothetical protein